jgi:hypothetical protein
MTKIHRRWVTVAAVTVMAAALVGGTAVVALDQGRAEGWSEIAAQLPASVGPVLPDTDRPAAVTPVVEPDAAEEVADQVLAQYPDVDRGALIDALHRGDLYAWSVASGGVEYCRSYAVGRDGRIWSLEHGLYAHQGRALSTTRDDWNCSAQQKPGS